MRKKTRHPSDDFDDNLINLTPLIDVVFVVLVSFILIAPLLEADHINLASSSMTSDKNIQPSSVVIKVRQDNTIYFNNKICSIDDLKKSLKEKKSQNPKCSLQLYHDKKAEFGTYQAIKNVAESSGFEEMDVILNPN